MFIKIQYQCYNLDTGKALTDKDLKMFVVARDEMFREFLTEKGYALLATDYDPRRGMRELFFEKVVSA